jgi:hypothetical protein
MNFSAKISTRNVYDHVSEQQWVRKQGSVHLHADYSKFAKEKKSNLI